MTNQSRSVGIIGHTGFVGGNLAAQVGPFDGYNSKNIEDIAGKEYHGKVWPGDCAFPDFTMTGTR